MSALAQFLAGRSPGERRVLLFVGAVVVIALVAAFAWLPLERQRSRLAAQLPTLRASIVALERQAEEAKRLRALPPVAQATNEPIATLAAAGGKTLAGAQITVVDAKTIAVTATDVAFGALLEWLATTQAAQGFRVESARIEALPAAGRVRAELRLKRS